MEMIAEGDRVVDFLSGFGMIVGLLFVTVLVAAVALLLLVKLMRWVVSLMGGVFFVLNKLLWCFAAPLRFLCKDHESSFGRVLSLTANITLIYPLYRTVYYVLTTRFRAISAIYYTCLLFWAAALHDMVFDILLPKLNGLRHKKGVDYLTEWGESFPDRVDKAVFYVIKAIVLPIFKLPREIILPHYTMYHGTSFERAGAPIIKDGVWMYGAGVHAGRGIYFGILKRTAKHYGRECVGSKESAILLCRVCVWPCVTTGALPKSIKRYIGSLGWMINSKLPWFIKAVEHWREDDSRLRRYSDGRYCNCKKSWFEYCLLQDREDTAVSLWRARPLQLLRKGNRPERIWGGARVWCGGIRAVCVDLVCWAICAAIYLWWEDINRIPFIKNILAIESHLWEITSEWVMGLVEAICRLLENLRDQLSNL